MRNSGPSLWRAAGFVALGLVPAIGSGGEGAAKPREIRLKECDIRPIDRVVLACDRPGILKFIEPREGEFVRAKQKVAGLDDKLIRADLDAAEHKATNDIEIRASRKAYELAKVEHEKAVAANRDVRNAVPQIEVERLKLAAEKAAFEIELAEHELTLNQLQRDVKRQELATYAIDSPISGVVTKVYRQRGEAVRQGDPILEVTSTERVRVEGWLELEHAWQVSVGNTVIVQLDIPDVELPVEQRQFEGKITFVDVGVQAVTRQTKVVADVVNPDNLLRAGLTADMTIRLDPPGKPKTPGDLQTATARTKPDSPPPFRRMNRVTGYRDLP